MKEIEGYTNVGPYVFIGKFNNMFTIISKFFLRNTNLNLVKHSKMLIYRKIQEGNTYSLGGFKIFF